jgi:L-aminopeptidase/D-esterase-like protein
MIRPGARNLITDVPSILVGNAEGHAARSGVTVVLPEAGAVCAVDVRGGAPGTRETDALDPAGLIEVVHAMVLSGGSAFGLDAAGGAMAWLAARGQGFRATDARIPIVPAAILFDLHNGRDKAWGDLPPYRELGRRACAVAARDFALGNAGAGLGATAGHLKGGLGSGSFVIERDDGEPPDDRRARGGQRARRRDHAGERRVLGLAGRAGGRVRRPLPERRPEALAPRGRAQVRARHQHHPGRGRNRCRAQQDPGRAARGHGRSASRARSGRHTPRSTAIPCSRSRPAGSRLRSPPLDLARLGTLAADCVSRAIARRVYGATDLGAMRSYRSVHGAQREADIK